MALDDKIGFVRRMSMGQISSLRAPVERDVVLHDKVQDRLLILDREGKGVYGSLEYSIKKIVDDNNTLLRKIGKERGYIVVELADGQKGIVRRNGETFGKTFQGDLVYEEDDFDNIGEIWTTSLNGSRYVQIKTEGGIALMSRDTVRPLDERVKKVIEPKDFNGKQWLSVNVGWKKRNLTDEQGTFLFKNDFQHIGKVMNVDGASYLVIKRDDDLADLVDAEGNLLFGDMVNAEKIYRTFVFNGEPVIYIKEQTEGKYPYQFRGVDGATVEACSKPINGICRFEGKDMLNLAKGHNQVVVYRDNGKVRRFGSEEGYDTIATKGITDPEGNKYIFVLEGIDHRDRPEHVLVIGQDGEQFGRKLRYKAGRRLIYGAQFLDNSQLQLEWGVPGKDERRKRVIVMHRDGEILSNEKVHLDGEVKPLTAPKWRYTA